MKRASFLIKVLPVSLGIAVASLSPSAQAANAAYTLTGTGANNWSTATWSDTIANIGAGDIAAFNTASNSSTTTLDTAVTLGQLQVGTASTSSWTILASGANAFTFDGTGITAGNQIFGNAGVAAIGSRSAGGNLSIAPNIVIANTDVDVGNTNTGALTLSGSITATSNQNLNFRGSGSGAVTVSGNIGMSGSNIAISNLRGSGGNVTISGTLGSSVTTVTQNSSASVLTLSASNTYSGGTTISAGTLVTGNGSALGSGTLTMNGGTFKNGATGANITNNIVIGSGTNTLTENNTNNFNFTGGLSGAGNVTFGGGGGNASIGLQFSANTMTSGTITLIGGATGVARIRNTASSNAAVDWVFSGNTASTEVSGTFNFGSFGGSGNFNAFNGNSGTTLFSIGGNNHDATYSAVLSANGTGQVLSVLKVGTGTETFSGANSYTGGTTINSGTLVLANAAALNTTNGGISFGGGTLQYGSGITTDYSARIAAGTSGSAVAIDTGTNNVTFATALTGTQSGGLTKSGSGTLTLSANNAYTGVTTVNLGTLKVSGTIGNTGGTVVNSGATLAVTGAIGSAGGVSVNSGGTLTGSGVVSGTATVAVGGILTNGNTNTAALTLGGLTFSGAGGTVNINTAGSAGIVVTNALTTSGSAVTINIPTAPVWSNGTTYNLISYGSFSGALSDFVKGSISGLGGRQSATLGTSGSAITLAIAGDTPYWTGALSNAWTTLTSDTNWKLVTAATPTYFMTNDQVLFDDNATGSTSVDISTANVQVASVSFNNSTKNYTISSSGGFGITGTGATLTKSGTGMVTLTTTNSYTGITTINNGTLQLGDGTTNGDIATSSGIINNASLVFNRTAGSTFTYANAISGTGAVTVSGSGTQVLAGVNSYSGGTTITSSTLSIGGAGQLGSGSYAGNITNNGVLSYDSSAAQTFSGSISGTGTIIKATSSAGTLTLSASNSYSGGTTVSAGTLQLGNNAAAGSGTITLAGGTLANSAGISIANTINVTAASTLQISTTGNGFNWDMTGSLTGSGNLTYSPAGFPATLTLLGDNSGYSGTFTQSNVANNALSFNNALAGSGSAAWVLSNNFSGRTRFFNFSGTINFGSLAGSNAGIINNTAGTVNVTEGALNTDSTFSGSFIAGTGVIALTKVGSGAWTLSGNSSYTGGTTLNAGTLGYGNNNALGSGTLTLNAGTLKAAAGNLTLPNNINVAGTSVLDMAANNTTWSGAISGTAALTLNNSGVPSTLTLSGSNEGYSGTFTVNNNNAVDFTSPNSGSAAAAWVFNDANAGRVRIDVGNDTINFGSIAGNGQIQNNTPSYLSTISVGALNTDTTFNGTIKDNGTAILALTKVGTGSLTLTGSNTYSDATNVNNGTLNVNNALASHTINVASPATLNVGSTAATGTATSMTIDGQANLSGTDGSIFAVGSLTVDLTGTTTLTAHGGGASNVKVLDLSALSIATSFDLTGNAAGGGQGESELISPAPVPEPGTWAMLLVGLGTMAVFQHRRRRTISSIE